jgi:acyl-coenzyme A thioesterase PaaI-like protein
MQARWLRHFMNLWPPFLFSGIHVAELARDWSRARVELRARPWNRNYVGTHFGGSLFAMADPFWMLLVLHAIGEDHVVWDRAAEIAFEKPGRGTVSATFALDPATVGEIRAETADGEKQLRWFATDIVDADGEVVARVRKQLYVRRKRGR